MPLAIYPAGHHLYKVVNKDTGFVHAKHTTLSKAKAQVRLINMGEKKTGSYRYLRHPMTF